MKNRLAIRSALSLALVLAAGCAEVRVPRIDPSGQHVFIEPTPECTPSTRPEPLLDSRRNAQLTVAPAAVVAPVNSEVILLASVRGPDNFLLTNERVEWSIAPGGVGQIVAVGRNGVSDVLLGEFWRGKIDNSYAIGTTGRESLRLARGTANPRDDVAVLPGQAWLTVTSPIEGTTHVLVFAPRTTAWECQKRTATIQWIDSEWQFPPPAINSAGTRHAFTTTVLRRSSQCPCVGWRVRYQIVDGPRAGFAPSGAASVDVETNAAGQGVAEILQPQPTPGTNRVAIQIFRPPLPGDAGPLLIASGGALMTWTSPQIGLRKLGPAVVGQGAPFTYRIMVSNPGDLAAEDVVVVDDIPPELTYVESHPAAELSAGKLRWRLGRLAARETRPLEATFRAQQLGSVTACASATAAGGLQARDCATTTVAGPRIEVKINGPQRAAVGSEVTFDVMVSNAGPAAATSLTIRDSLQPGMEHALKRRAIERDIDNLAPGQTLRIQVKVRLTRAGRLCHQVEIRGVDRSLQASAEGCVDAVEAAPAANAEGARPGPETRIPAPLEPQFRAEPRAGGPALAQSAPTTPLIAVKVTGPATRNVDDTALFEITVTNMGFQRLTNVRISSHADAELVPEQASAGWHRDGDNLVWTVETLTPGRANRFQVQCRCFRPSGKACDHVDVVSDDAPRAQGEACLEIHGAAPAPRNLEPPTFPPESRKPARPEGPSSRGNITPPPISPSISPPSVWPAQPGQSRGPAPRTSPPAVPLGPGLTMRVSDLNNPVNVGQAANYEIRVANNSTQPDQQAVVTVIVPSGMLPMLDGTSGPTAPTLDGRNVRFAPLADIAPGGEHIYKVRVRAQQPGSFPVRFELTSQAVRQGLAVTKTTLVNPQ